MKVDSNNIAHITGLWMETGKLLRHRIFCDEKNINSNPQQLYALFIVHETDGLTMKDLATRLGITSPSATSLVNRLVKLKWVKRASDPKNRKLVRLHIAPTGKKVFGEKMREVSRGMGNVLSLLNKQDRSDFARVLTALHAVLSKESKH